MQGSERRSWTITTEQLIKIIAAISIFSRLVLWVSLPDETKAELTTEQRAEIVGLSVEDFDTVARVTEAESDRTDNFEAKVMIAEVIWNRVRSKSFPNTAIKVVSQSGQFQVYSERTYHSTHSDLAEQAVIEAYLRVYAEQAPNVIYFNCISYMKGFEPYDCIGGNYFSLG